jgi:hypothetical protein
LDEKQLRVIGLAQPPAPPIWASLAGRCTERPPLRGFFALGREQNALVGGRLAVYIEADHLDVAAARRSVSRELATDVSTRCLEEAALSLR